MSSSDFSEILFSIPLKFSISLVILILLCLGIINAFLFVKKLPKPKQTVIEDDAKEIKSMISIEMDEINKEYYN